MKPYLVIADLDPPHAPFAVLSVDPTQRVDGGCKAIVLSLHYSREEAEKEIVNADRR